MSEPQPGAPGAPEFLAPAYAAGWSLSFLRDTSVVGQSRWELGLIRPAPEGEKYTWIGQHASGASAEEALRRALAAEPSPLGYKTTGPARSTRPATVSNINSLEDLGL